MFEATSSLSEFPLSSLSNATFREGPVLGVYRWGSRFRVVVGHYGTVLLLDRVPMLLPARRGLVCKAHKIVYHSTLGLRVIRKKKKTTSPGLPETAKDLAASERGVNNVQELKIVT